MFATLILGLFTCFGLHAGMYAAPSHMLQVYLAYAMFDHMPSVDIELHAA